MSNLTPMLRQYLEIKNQYKGIVLFYRLGDFYEMFFEDAEIAARELEIVLTSREGGSLGRIPMAGIPYHAADGYIARLIEKGYKIAICEQVEDPKQAKGVVKREVVRMITPGTILDERVLEEKKNNYILALTFQNDEYGIAYADLSTGEFKATQIQGEKSVQQLQAELCRLRPSECLIEESLKDNNEIISMIQKYVSIPINYTPSEKFKLDKATDVLCRHFKVISLEVFGCTGFPLAISAAGAVLSYLLDTQMTDLSHINALKVYSTEEYMLLDASTRRNLELTQTMRDGQRKGSLLGVVDQTVTAMGGRLLRNWLEQPLLSLEKIKQRLDAVEELTGDIFLREDIREQLKKVYDLERLICRVVYGSANARDLNALKNSFAVLPMLKELLGKTNSSLLKESHEKIDVMEDLCELVSKSIVEMPPFSVREGNMILPGYNEDLDKLREASRGGKSWIANLEAKERERSGIKSLKVGFNKVFGYYIEVTAANLAAVPEDYLRKQTLANAERYITPELKEYESLVLGAEEKIAQLEFELFTEIRQKIAGEAGRIQRTANLIAKIDALLSLAEVAVNNNYVKPRVELGEDISIEDGRHPVVEKMLGDGQYVPNDTGLDCEENQLLIITGPNMAGKSTYMRQVALIVLLAQVGSFVPAGEARIGIVDRIFTRVGASDDLATGQSTFMVEMNEVSNILNNATSRSLLILDEVGRGTSTFDGLSIAWAVVEYIHGKDRIGAKCLFATHYHELTELEKSLSGVKNYSVQVKERGEEITFLRKIGRGGSDRSYGIQVARLAGLPASVLDRAKEILFDLEKNRHLQAKTKKKEEEKKVSQMSLFEPEIHPAVELLKEMDVLNMTPMQALNKLHELSQLARGRK